MLARLVVAPPLLRESRTQHTVDLTGVTESQSSGFTPITVRFSKASSPPAQDGGARGRVTLRDGHIAVGDVVRQFREHLKGARALSAAGLSFRGSSERVEDRSHSTSKYFGV